MCDLNNIDKEKIRKIYQLYLSQDKTSDLRKFIKEEKKT